MVLTITNPVVEIRFLKYRRRASYIDHRDYTKAAFLNSLLDALERDRPEIKVRN